MNPFDLSASDLMIWGLVLHLIADWPLQNDWMAKHKQSLLHPASWVHGSIHGLLLALVFGWAAIPLMIVHMIVDTRGPVVWWSKRVRQTQPENRFTMRPGHDDFIDAIPIYDIGTEVRFWTDQVFHIACIAVAALVIA
jgi:hypothetical protein